MKYLAFTALAVWSTLAAAIGEPTKHLSVAELRAVRSPDVVLDSVGVPPELPTNASAPQYIQVKGTIGGTIHFELLLPETWNERFVMGGGGGFVGTVQNGERFSVTQGYATVGTDTGHKQTLLLTASWAFNNMEAQLNFGYLAVHRTAAVAKALIRAYYGKDPLHSYFIGCSRGGGQAMMEAQRYPNDFEGIVAGAPAFDWTGFAATSVTIAKTLYPNPNHLDTNILTKDALEKLRQSILDQCDALDGLKDGIVGDPGTANFDLTKVPGLSEEQRNAIRVIYDGARNNQGLIYPGYTPGSECDPNSWIAWITGPVTPLLEREHAPSLMFGFGTQIFKYLVFNQPDWDYSTYNFSHFAQDTRMAASYLDATNANLDSFKSRKGKIILWHGWADPALPAQATVDYFRRVQARDPNAAGYCRLFMIPGCLHCGGGPGASDVDWLELIRNWVEDGHAPDRLIASKKEKGKVVMTRPLYPYPQTVSYKGSGDPNSADSFVPKSIAGAIH